MNTTEKQIRVIKFEGDITAFGDVINLNKYTEKESELLDPYDPKYTEDVEPTNHIPSRKESTEFRKMRMLEHNMQAANIPYEFVNGMYAVTKRCNHLFQTRYIFIQGKNFCFGTARKVTYTETSIRKFMTELKDWFSH